jgi:acyl-CoA dehydrogenase
LHPTQILGLPLPGWVNEDVAMVREMAGRFMEHEVVPGYHEYEDAGIVPRSLWRKAGANGLLCASMPEEYGGAGGTYAHEAAIIEALCHNGVDGFGIALHSGIVAPYILNHGSEEQKRKWLPKLASGELIGAVAMTEPAAGSDLRGVQTSAVRDGNHYRINGSKTFITNGQNANLIIIVAKTDPSAGTEGISLIVVDTDEVEGFERGRNLDKIGLKANDTSELFFNDMRVPTANLLGSDEGQGFAQLMSELPQERLIIANQAVAAIERALALTIDYTKERKAFGKTLLEFQNTQFTLAQLKAEAVQARIFTDWCVTQHLNGKLDTPTASMVKMLTSDLQCKVIDQCLQFFGGYGYMNEYPIARMFRDARVKRIYGGTNEIMKLIIARSL